METEKNKENSEAHGQNKEVSIIVNGRQKIFTEKKITFQQVVELAFGNYIERDSLIYTVTYSKGEDKKEGTMLKGDIVHVKDGMIFNVTSTDKS